MPSTSLKDLFTNLKDGIIGTKTTKIDDQIDASLHALQTYSNSKSLNAYTNVMKNLVKEVGSPQDDDFLKEIETVGDASAMGQGERVNRYNEYEQIVLKIAYCARALKVLTDNIIAPDDITKRSIQVTSEDDKKISDEDNTTVITRTKQILNSIELDSHCDMLVSDTMKLGDQFIEVLYSPKGENAMQVLTESTIDTDPAWHELPKLEETIEYEIPVGPLDKMKKPKTEKRKINITLYEFNPFGGALFQKPPTVQGPAAWTTASGMPITHKPYNVTSRSKDPNIAKTTNNDPYEKNLKNKGIEFDSKFSKEDEESKNRLDNKNKELVDIFITFHDPRTIVKLQTERFRTCLGYLVFPTVDPGIRQAALWNTNVGSVDQVCTKIIKQLQDKIDTGRDKLPKHGDLRDVISKYLKDIQDGEDLKIRYVTPDMISHWKIGSNIYDPYGQSIFDSIKFDAKVLMAMKVAHTIKQLTSCTDKRVIKVETGLPRDAKNLVELLKEGMRKRKISLDKFGSVDSIPSMVSTFEDIYIPMRDGKEFVSFEQQQWGQDAQLDIEPMKFVRDNLVANLMVPPAFLGLEENVCLSFFTKIRLLEGYDVDIGRLAEEYKKDPDNFNKWTYSIDPETHRIVPGKIIKAIATRKNAQMVRVYLDNDKYEECTPDHKWMLRDGTYKEAKDLKKDDSLMPLYIRKSNIRTKNNTPYMQVYHPSTGRWQTIHRVVCEGLDIAKKNDGMHVHHIDENPLDNHPDNLFVCTREVHWKIHSDEYRYNAQDKSTYAIIDKRNCVICNKEFECRLQSNQSTCLSTECKTERKRLDGHKSWQRKKELCGDDYNTVTATCAACGKEFETYKKYVDNMTHNMISCGTYECGRIVSGKKTTLTTLGEPVETNCVICDKPITITHPKRNLTNTCGEICRNTVLARRRHEGNRQSSQCSFCGKEIFPTETERKLNEFLPCDNSECKHAKQGVKLYLQKNPDITIEQYIHKFNQRQLPFQINNDSKIDQPLFTDCLKRIDKKGRSEQYVYDCDECGKEVSVCKSDWDNKKYRPMKTCKDKACSNKAKSFNSVYKRSSQVPVKDDEQLVLNHKVVKVEYLEERQDCYDIEVEKYHNFALSSGVFVHNSNRALLTVENILFARTIIMYQREFSELMKDLVQKVYILIYPDGVGDLAHITITFPPPKASPFEHQMEYIEQMLRIIEAMKQLGVPEEYSKRKYLPDFPWDEAQQASAEAKGKKELGEDGGEDQAVAGYGGGF